MAVTIERVGTTFDDLGEGPLWDTAEQALYWVDSEGCEIFRLDSQMRAFKSWRVPGRIGSMALREKGGAVVALETGFHLFDFATGMASKIADPEADESRTRFNDGKVDARGRFLAGTLHHELAEPLGSLYRLDPDLKVTKLQDKVVCSNGPCWSPDNRTFYFSDSVPRTIFAFDYNLDSGAISNRRVFANTEKIGGAPDGCTVDADGRVWSALCTGGKIACFSPSGALERTIEMPARLVSSVMFGGPNLDVLYATSIGRTTAGVDPASSDGALFAIRGLNARGKPEPRFKG
jgi:L-arabinonolactonase